MNRAELRARIARRLNNVKHAELCALLEAYGWEHARTTGAHYLFSKAGERPIPVPKHGTVPAFVVRQVLNVTDEESEHAENVEE